MNKAPKGIRALSILFLLLGLVASVFVIAPAKAIMPRDVGFGFVSIGGLRVQGYTASTFFSAMFLTQPYPSTVELMMNNGINEITDTSNRAYLLSLMQMASSYPDVQLGLHVAFDVSNLTQWGLFQTFLNTVAASPYKSSLGFMGFAWEQVSILTTVHNGTYPTYASAQMQARLNTAGISFISYYCGTSFAPYLCLNHTNYPEGDNQADLTAGSGHANMVGATIGVDGIQPFPSPGCTSVFGGAGMPAWSIQAYAQGFFGTGYNNIAACDNIITHAGYLATIDQVLAAEATLPSANSEYTFVIAGNMGSCFLGGTCAGGSGNLVSFTGVSGRTTHFLWDNPTFRQEMTNWLAANPGSYTLNSLGATTTTSTVTSTVTTTITSSSTTATTTYPTTYTTTLEITSTSTTTLPSPSSSSFTTATATTFTTTHIPDIPIEFIPIAALLAGASYMIISRRAGLPAKRF